MKFEELLKKYQALLNENNSLKEEIVNLKAKLNAYNLVRQDEFNGNYSAISLDNLCSEEYSSDELSYNNDENQILRSNINNSSETTEKIKLFM